MDYAYHAALWQTFYSVIAGAAATLTGLLFVGMSLNLRTILGMPAHRARARETFGGLLSLLVLALLVLIPGQSALALGCELAIGALALFVWSLRLQGQTLSRMAPGKRLRWGLRVSIINFGTLLIIFTGLDLILGRFGGLYWLLPTILIYLLWDLNNAWLLVVQVAEEATETLLPSDGARDRDDAEDG